MFERYEHLYTSLWTCAFISLRYTPKSEMVGECLTFEETAMFHSHLQSTREFQFLHILANTWHHESF